MEAERSLAVLPPRVKGSYTDTFRSVNIMSNHYPVTLKQNMDFIYTFSIRFDPFIPYDNRKKREEIIRGVLDQIKSFIPNCAICGMNILTTTKPLQENKEITAGEYKVSIKQVRVVEAAKDPKSLLFFLNNRFRNAMSQLGYAQIGKTGKYFNIKYKKDLQDLTMYSGCKASFVFLEKGIYLRMDSAKKIVRNQTVLQYIDSLYKKNHGKERDDKRNIVDNALAGQVVQVNYGNGRYYKVEKVVYQQLEETILEGEKINIIEYYKKKYNININKLKQPLIKVENPKGKMEILLVPELCNMTGIPQDFDEFKRKQVSQNTILDAPSKLREIKQLMSDLDNHGEFKQLSKIGISLSSRMNEMKAKEVPTPRVTLGKDNSIEQGKQAFFNLFNKPIYASKHKIRCGIISFRSADLRDLLRTFETTSRNLNVEFKIEQIQAKDDRRGVQSISRAIQKAIDRDCNICLIVIPNHLQSQYKRIKEASLIDNKMVCQVAREGTLRKKNAQSICTKILLQIIAKKGNTLWVPVTKGTFEDVMLVGIDTAKISGNKNVLSMVGTVNSTFTSYNTKNAIFESNDTKFQKMSSLLMKIVNYYVDRNKKAPKQIILLSNSCTGDQIKLYQQFFIADFQKQCDNIYKDSPIALSMVMVNVKVSDRFFTDRGDNVRAGTLINSDVVTKDYDFFLISQGSNKGCIVPNHYKVIYSNSKMEEGCLQELVYAQCFNYVNWSGSIKVPGVLQYAKKSAKFNSETMESKEVEEGLERYLYYV